MPSTGSSVDQTWARKKQKKLKIGQTKLPRLKQKEKVKKKVQELWDNMKLSNICACIGYILLCKKLSQNSAI